MRSGALKHKVYIQRLVTERDATGQPVRGYWEVVTSGWAEIRALRGQEQIEAAQITDKQYVQINMRYQAGIDSQMRVVRENSRLYWLQGVTNVRRRGREMILTAITTPTEYPRFVYYDEGVAAGDPYHGVVSFKSDAPSSTRVRYREVDASAWTYLSEKDLAPRVFEHGETLGPLTGDKNYECEIWGEGPTGYTPGWHALDVFGIAGDGSFVVGGIVPPSAPVIVSGPTAVPGVDYVNISWATDVNAWHRIQWRKTGEASWNVEGWFGPTTNISHYIGGLESERTEYQFQVEACLVGDGSASTGWVPLPAPTFETLCDVVSYYGFGASKTIGDMLRITWNTHKKADMKQARWKFGPEGAWNTSTEQATSGTSHFIHFDPFGWLPGIYYYQVRNRNVCGTWGAWSAEQQFNVDPGGDIT